MMSTLLPTHLVESRRRLRSPRAGATASRCYLDGRGLATSSASTGRGAPGDARAPGPRDAAADRGRAPHRARRCRSAGRLGRRPRAPAGAERDALRARAGRCAGGSVPAAARRRQREQPRDERRRRCPTADGAWSTRGAPRPRARPRPRRLLRRRARSIARLRRQPLGQRHWHHVESFHFDWCLYHAGRQGGEERATPAAHWDDAEFAAPDARWRASSSPLLAQPPRTLPPGAYRAYLAPTAMAEMLGMLGWGGFGAEARRTKHVEPDPRLAHGDARLHRRRSRCARTRPRGIAPAFTADGFAKPAAVRLVAATAVAAGTLVSPRSAREYGAADQRRQRRRVAGSRCASPPARSPRPTCSQALDTGSTSATSGT